MQRDDTSPTPPASKGTSAALSRTQRIIASLAILWLAGSAVIGLQLARDSIGSLPVLSATIPLVVTTPLAVLGFLWLSVGSSTPSRLLMLTVLVLPLLLGVVGFAVGSAIRNRKNREWLANNPYLRTAVLAPKQCWARPLTSLSRSADFCGDSTYITNLRVAQVRTSYGQVGISITGVVRNSGASTIQLEGYWGQYLSPSSEPVSDFNCNAWDRAVVYATSCGFSRRDLFPGYVADFGDTLLLGPSVARQDTVSFFIRFHAVQ